MTIAWEPWGPEAFARAEHEKKPVLLLLSGLVASTSNISDKDAAAFIPVLCDHRDRPDVGRRFDANAGLAVVDHNFSVIEAVDVYSENLSASLKRAVAGYRPSVKKMEAAASGKPAWTGAVGFAAPAALDVARPMGRVEAIKRAKDALDLRSLELLMHAAGDWGDQGAGRLSSAQLERWRSSSIDRDIWNSAYFLRLFSDGAALLESPALADRAQQLGSAVLGVYKKGKPIERLSGDLELHAYADANAFAVLGLLRLARLGNKPALDAALDLLATLEKEFYDPMLGMVHRKSTNAKPIVYGLLDDNAWTALAFTEAYLATGLKPFREFADTIAKFLFQELWDRDRGGFVDRIQQKEDLAPLKRRVRPAYENAVAFEVLWRLHHLKGNANYKKWLDWGLRSLLAEVDVEETAPLLRVQDMLQRGRCDLELVGKRDDPKTQALLDAVNALYVPRKIVSFVDPDDQDYVLAHKLEAASYPRLFGCDKSLKRVADAAEPKDVAAVIEALR